MTAATNYVAGLVFSMPQIMLIRKDRPNWMKGKLNGIGGHVEPNESPLDAMCREFGEETKLIPPCWKHFATLTDTFTNKPQQPWLVHWFTATVPNVIHYIPEGTIDEPVGWFHIQDLHYYPLMPSLLWLIHMALECINNPNTRHKYQINEEY